ncbi:MAG: hypothetical protein JNL61_20295, partial [Rhizobiaceae bacterium]|nr:hypothetical protein [Rhizobiaceae bacterium]
TESRHDLRPTMAETGFVWFQRVIAAYSLLFGLLYWIRLIGLYSGPLWRFDLMPVHWQVATVTLAVFYPFAAIGLWMLASWGPVIWFICAATETVMYALFPALYGYRFSIVLSHLLVVALYCAFRIVIYTQRRARLA